MQPAANANRQLVRERLDGSGDMKPEANASHQLLREPLAAVGAWNLHPKSMAKNWFANGWINTAHHDCTVQGDCLALCLRFIGTFSID